MCLYREKNGGIILQKGFVEMLMRCIVEVREMNIRLVSIENTKLNEKLFNIKELRIIIREIWRSNKYDTIIEKRNGYRVEYNPINLISRTFSESYIVFESEFDLKEMNEIMEREFEYLIKKFPVPLMLCAFNTKDDKIYFDDIKHGDELIGTIMNGKINKTWGITNFESSKTYISDETLNSIYNNISHRTKKQLEDKAKNYISDKKKTVIIFRLLALAWMVIGVLIIILGYFDAFYIGVITGSYSIYKAIENYNKSRGKISKKEKFRKEKMDKMKHYYYHCELNQEAFSKLRAENYKNNRV